MSLTIALTLSDTGTVASATNAASGCTANRLRYASTVSQDNTQSPRCVRPRSRKRRRCSPTSGAHGVDQPEPCALVVCDSLPLGADVWTDNTFQHDRAAHPELLSQQRGLQLVAQLANPLDAQSVLRLGRNTAGEQHIHEWVAREHDRIEC